MFRALPLPVLALPIPMIESAFQALLVPAVGATPLPEPGGGTARGAAIAVPAVAVRTDEEHGAAVAAHATSKSQNRFVVCRHACAQADPGQRGPVRGTLETGLACDLTRVAHPEPRRR